MPSASTEVIRRLEAKLDRLEAKLDRVVGLLGPALDHGPAAIATATDTFDAWVREHDDVDERLRRGLRVLERVTRPDTLALLERAVELAEALPPTLAVAVDTVDDLARRAAEGGLELHELVPRLGKASTSLVELVTSDQVQALLDSELLLPEVIDSIGCATRALANASRAPQEGVGVLGLIQALRDPDVQRGLGFLLDVTRRFGATIEPQRSATP